MARKLQSDSRTDGAPPGSLHPVVGRGVYVDSLKFREPRNLRTKTAGKKWGQQWCHLWADAEDDLHAMAVNLGLLRRWCQKKPGKITHYDLVPSKRKAALELGCVETTLPDWKRARQHPPKQLIQPTELALSHGTDPKN